MMIQWLVQSTASHPDLALGQPPDGLLSEPETGRLAGLRMPKRRRDWLLGRWTAKHLLKNFIQDQTGARLPLHSLTVDNEPQGRPFARVEGWQDVTSNGGHAVLPLLTGQDGRLAINLSISHSSDRAFCAVHPGARVHVGADIELVEPRPWQFVGQYFTDEEIEQVADSPDSVQDLLVTAIWSGKEAVLKALGLGLTVDTRRVSCTLSGDLTTAPKFSWLPFHIACDPLLFSETTLAYAESGPERQPGGTPDLTGLWRLMDNYALALVLCQR